ncbi:hypothetical protein HYW87_01110 [Candidatus Roizmanbacteria bacterium]|nr:hypothetical protein [Candidatus Roizmanbacteria bacterium]
MEIRKFAKLFTATIGLSTIAMVGCSQPQVQEPPGGIRIVGTVEMNKLPTISFATSTPVIPSEVLQKGDDLPEYLRLEALKAGFENGMLDLILYQINDPTNNVWGGGSWRLMSSPTNPSSVYYFGHLVGGGDLLPTAYRDFSNYPISGLKVETFHPQDQYRIPQPFAYILRNGPLPTLSEECKGLSGCPSDEGFRYIKEIIDSRVKTYLIR